MEHIFTPSEICAKLNGITPRQITDLAEKKIIIPAKDTPGQGSMRLYDKKNIREILIALALRGYISGDALKVTLNEIRECGPDVEVIGISHGKKRNVFHITAIMKTTDNMAGTISFGKDLGVTATPRSFVDFWVYVAKIEDFIKNNF